MDEEETKKAMEDERVKNRLAVIMSHCSVCDKCSSLALELNRIQEEIYQHAITEGGN